MFATVRETGERLAQWLQGRSKARWLLAVVYYGVGFAALGVVTDGKSFSFNLVAHMGLAMMMSTVDVWLYTKASGK